VSASTDATGGHDGPARSSDGSNLPSEAIHTIHRILNTSEAAIVTIPGISQICRPDTDSWGEYWRFTTLSARRLFKEVFEPANVTVDGYGNALTASAFLYGLATEDRSHRELDLYDPDHKVTIGIKALVSPQPLRHHRRENVEPRIVADVMSGGDPSPAPTEGPRHRDDAAAWSQPLRAHHFQ
jgi:hypothetical protein